MITIKNRLSGSWLEPASARILAAQTSADIASVLEGRRALFISLTYRRGEYANPLDLYRCQAERQDVPMFLRRLSRFLGRSLSGKWIRKMEFQSGGWVHFHVVLLTDRFIPKAKLTELWGHGFVDIQRVKGIKGVANYAAKRVASYTGKAGDYPAFLYAERPRSVKIIATSPGFWKGVRERKSKSKPYFASIRPATYQPIGEVLRKRTACVVVREKLASGHRFSTYNIEFALFVRYILQVGGSIEAAGHGWLSLDLSPQQVHKLAGRILQGPGGREAAPGPLDLIPIRNPDKDGWASIPPWLSDVLREALEFEAPARMVRTLCGEIERAA